MDDAAKLARSADAVVLIAGYNHNDEGEFVADTDVAKSVDGDCVQSLGLQKDDIELFQTIGSVNPNTAVVLIGGNMIMIVERQCSGYSHGTLPWDGGRNGYCQNFVWRHKSRRETPFCSAQEGK